MYTQEQVHECARNIRRWTNYFRMERWNKSTQISFTKFPYTSFYKKIASVLTFPSSIDAFY
ncbi:ORF180 [White spot syndrome virus]|uniref:Wsv121 n=3 Tax=White spot syndrome virus TaxID=342409 RepID=Q8VB67_WSSVS|nr:wsv121 [Shrimp white spot syndrome virus]AFX59498.1 wsv121 [White spot syndrome virus]AAL33125.1 wsv121 [Shrimp white spot syndrome virus]AAL89045.1 WSSV177 [Shrimp white spot syndrome virus]ATU84212.1 ORF180 [White spot syndrome virus]AWQ60309.1 wsv121 [Shrimp white spot syndrome virus]